MSRVFLDDFCDAMRKALLENSNKNSIPIPNESGDIYDHMPRDAEPYNLSGTDLLLQAFQDNEKECKNISKNYIYETRIQELTFLDFISIYQIYTGRDDEVIKSMLILPPRRAHEAS